MKARTNLFIVIMSGLLALCPTALGVSDSNLVAHWQFDEGSGTIAYDSAGNNHGTIYGAQWTTGIIGGALNFDGDEDYVEIPDADCLTPRYEITISWWIFNRGGQSASIYKYAMCPGEPSSPGNSRAYHLSVNDNYINNNSYTTMAIFSAVNTYDYLSYITSDNQWSLNGWHHVVGTFNRGQAAIYIDGEMKASKTFTVSSIMNDAQPLIIGGLWEYCGTDSFQSCLNGLADDVRIYNRALSAEEIQQIYQAVVPPEMPETYYVDGINGNDLNDGLSLETAFATVQKGINTAKDGNTVLVYPAVYSEAVNFLGKAIMVQGIATTAGIPILENPGDFAASFYNGEGPDSILKNFVIKNSFMAVFISGCSPTISNVTVVDNKYGIAAYTGAGTDISNCIFWNNTDMDLFGCQARYSWVQDTKPQPLEGLISNWRFDEGSGTIAHDSVGSNHGTIYGAQWTTGILDGALNFDGINDYIEVPDTNALRFSQTDSFSISLWAKPSPGSTGYLVDKMRSGGKKGVFGYLMGYNEDNGSKFWLDIEKSNVGHTAVFSSFVLEDVWYYVTGVYDNKIMKIYLNGQLQNTTTFAYDTGNTTPDKNLAIGARSCDNVIDRSFNGAIDDVRIYNRALSAEEIRQLYQGRLNLEPLFADAANGDYHLRSERGRYWQQHDIWVLDKVTSPCVDGGDPTIDPSGEPMPNGGRIDMGAYGGTPYASMSKWPLTTDTNRDGAVDLADLATFCNEWLSTLPWAE